MYHTKYYNDRRPIMQFDGQVQFAKERFCHVQATCNGKKYQTQDLARC